MCNVLSLPLYVECYHHTGIGTKILVIATDTIVRLNGKKASHACSKVKQAISPTPDHRQKEPHTRATPMVFMAAVNGAPHIPGMGGWVTYGVQNREVHDGEWWKGNGNGAAGAGLEAGPAWWGHGKEATSWQSELRAVWSRGQALRTALHHSRPDTWTTNFSKK